MLEIPRSHALELSPKLRGLLVDFLARKIEKLKLQIAKKIILLRPVKDCSFITREWGPGRLKGGKIILATILGVTIFFSIKIFSEIQGVPKNLL